MQELNFPAYGFRLEERQQKKLIFDIVRKKFIPLTPEEWVRQHAIHHLIQHFGVARQTIAVERELRFHNLKKRFDLLVFTGQDQPKCIVECKAPNVRITTDTVMQLATYNQSFQCPWLWITNGLDHFWFRFENEKIVPSEAPSVL